MTKSKTLIPRIILVLGNPLNHEGGMVAFNMGLISAINQASNAFHLKHFSIGSRMSLFYYPVLKRLVYPLLLIFDVVRLFVTLFKSEIKVIQLNPSLIPVPLIRDGLVQLMNYYVFRKKTVIVLHGWKQHVFDKIESNKFYSSLLIKFFNSADVIFVLSEEFKTKLIGINVDSSKIKVTTTFFYKDSIHVATESKYDQIDFIYLGRVSKLKGIYELIKAFELVEKKHHNFTCKIIGHGDKPKTLDFYKNLVRKNNLEDKVFFLGRKTGDEKFRLLSEADIYIFPSYMEGCPTSAIEALASGLFVISTDVGALNDIINDFNGIKVKPKQVKELANAISRSIENIMEIRSRKAAIAHTALENLEINRVSIQFHNVYCGLI